MDINLSYDQLNNDYSMLMSVLGASVSKHLIDEHFTCIWANDYYYELIRYPKPLYESLFHNRCDEYFRNNPEGWKLLTDRVLASFANGEKGYSLYVPMLSQEGERFWVKMQAVYTDEYIDGYQVAFTTMTDVTEMMLERQEQLQTQQAVEKMAHEQDMLMSALNVSVSKHLIDDHYTCVRANEFYYKLIGYPKEKYEKLFHNHPDEYYGNNPEGWELLSQEVTSVLERGGDQYELIVPMKYEDGSSYWVKLVSFFTDEYIDGYRTSYTVMTDVTELVQMKNEQDMLMRAMKVSVSRHLMDEHFSLVWANDFYYELIGYSKAEYQALFNNHGDEYFKGNETGWRSIQEKINWMFTEGTKSYETYLPLKIPDGSTRWVKMVGFVTDESQDGKLLAYTTMIDVTELMQVQQERTIAYDNIPGFIVKYRILPESVEIIEASDRIKDIFDVDLNNLSDLDPLAKLHPESLAFIRSQRQIMLKGEPFEGTIRIGDKYGKDRWFQLHSTCIDFIANAPVYLTILIDITDITELRELQHKLEERTALLNAALDTAKRANAAKSDFLSSMSHDIRTPMNVIAGMTKIACDHLDEPERLKDCLQKIQLSSHHLLGLINDVLDMSKIESGNFSINMAPIALPDVLREVIMITLAGVRTKAQKFDVHLIELEQEQFYSDSLRLRQILLNILSNASKFTPEGGTVNFDVEQLPYEKEDTVLIRFTVSDTGPGMKPEFQKHIFEAFTREQDSRTDKIEGSGLGMAITKRLTDILGGSITVESQPGSGSTFQVTLPMRPVPTPPPNCAAPGTSILLVDDDPAVLQHGRKALIARGAAAECAGSGEEALQMALSKHREGNDYSMIILDRDMPQTDGLAAARLICKQMPQNRPLLILSAYDWSEIKREALKAGIDGFVEKPLFGSVLCSCLREYLSKEVNQKRQACSYTFDGKVFLLAEDNELNREIAQELLGNLGARLEMAVNGEEAYNLFKSSVPGYYALILMDIQMPVMNGYQAARAIRALPRNDAAAVPIIAMTADAFVEDIRNAEEAGMNGHMAKPLNFETLAHKIAGYLGVTQQ